MRQGDGEVVELEGRPVRCLVCGSAPDRQAVLFEKAGVTFRRCSACGFELINPRPTERWLDARYRVLGSTYFVDAFKLKSDFAEGRYDLELRLLSGRAGRLLDVGCMTGAFVSAAKRSGFAASGIDLSAPAVEHGRSTFGLDLRVADFLSTTYEPRSFDVITLWATLEHLREPDRFLHRALELLAPSGVLALTVPNHSGITQRILGSKNRYVCVEHLNYFTGRTMSRLLGRCGFEIQKIWLRHFSPVPFLADLWSGARRVPGVHEMLKHQTYTDSVKHSAFLRPVRFLHSCVERGVSWLGAGDLMMVLARPRVA